ncbi:MAG: hypothetical protein A2007_01955 [Verrucomicrobia bacterium GWC2_42_7]|nr:MAG: hypothetical protein A2007_01955 [Verrucomicrobia bacterium GWC2_42_7]
MKSLNVKFIDGGECARAIVLRALSFDYEVREGDTPSVVFFSDDKLAKHKAFRDCLKIYVAIEYNYPNYGLCDYSLGFLPLSTSKNLRLPVYTWEDKGSELVKGENEWKNVIQSKDKFCAFVVSNGNKNRTWKRISFFHKLSNYKRIDSGGSFLNNVGHRVDDKLAFYKPYKFVLTFENQKNPWYTTEKLVHAMLSRCVPIYWGNSRIAEDFNPKSFINVGDFKNDEEAIQYIMKVDEDLALFEKYIKEPFFYGNKPNEFFNIERLRNFLSHAIEGPRNRREFFGYIPFKLLDIKKRIQPYYEKVLR